MLPAWAVRQVWDDPRRIPYLLIWKHQRDGTNKDAVRIVRQLPRTSLPEADSVEIKRTDGSTVPIYLAWRRQPHGGRSLLLKCWECQRPSRALYGWKVGNDGHICVPCLLTGNAEGAPNLVIPLKEAHSYFVAVWYRGTDNANPDQPL